MRLNRLRTRPARPHAPSGHGARPTDRRGSASSGFSGLLAGGVALLGLAAVPVAGIVADPSGATEPSATVIDGALAATTAAAPAAGTLGSDDPGVLAAADHHRPLPATTVPLQVLFAPEDDGTDDDAEEVAEEADEGPAEEPEVQTAAAEEPEPAAEEPAATAGGTVWDTLADCEAGDWDANGQPIPGTARWDYGLEFAHEGFEQFQGGLNFHPGTWEAFKDADMPDHAGHATRAQEIVVGERVLEAQGWGAWPVCSEMIGLR